MASERRRRLALGVAVHADQARARHPGQQRESVRAARHGRLSVFAEVYNLLGTTNVRGFWKHIDAQGRDVRVVTGEVNQWPRLPLAGLTWEF